MQRKNGNKKVIPNLIWNLQRKVVSQRQRERQAWKILNQVQDDNTNFTSGLPLTYHGNGFTLIELLVVVLIIGILAAVAVPQYQVAVLKSKVATMQSGVKAIAMAAEVYYLANGEYPSSDISAFDISEMTGCTPTNGSGYTDCAKGNIRYDFNGWHQPHSEDRIDGTVRKDETEIIKYVQFLENSPLYPGERYCIATDNFAISHKVCKSMQGSLAGHGITGSRSSDNTYKLP